MTPHVNGNSALFLDIDGTLLDLARTPDAVVVPAELSQTLTRLYDMLEGALAFVSGRSLSTIDTLFAPLSTPAVGCHGAEIRGADRKVRTLAPPISESMHAAFSAIAEAHPGVLLENKVYSLALHYRLAPEARPALDAALETLSVRLAAEHLSLIEGKAVIEARPTGINKGVGVRVLAAEPPFTTRKILFGGDDVTDLDVFHMLPEIGGAGFSVGKSFPGAAHVFDSPQAVRDWLARLARNGVAA